MNMLVQEATNREIIRAIGADEQANTNYYQILRRFVSGKAGIFGEESHQLRARLDADGLKEIDTAWLLLQTTGKKLRRAVMKLYISYL